ncbi:MAG: NAD(P)H:quinone oxidoreductase [Elusimicrobiota bacterium]
MKVLIVFYSAYGHVFKMAESVEKGVKEVKGAETILRQVQEILPEDVLKKTGVFDARKKFSHIPVCTNDELASADAVIFGTPTRFGNMCAQMRAFLDGTGSLWVKGSLVGKIGSVFTSSATQHGGQESTILSFHTTLLHQGMLIAGLPYLYQGQMRIDEVTGGSPYGASTIAGGQGERMPSENELSAAKFQGKYVALLTEVISKSRKNILDSLK